MQFKFLGSTGVSVSRLCLGTMTFGLQTDEPTARAILDEAADSGVNFIDTADVYPLGGDVHTVGRTEEIVGRWLQGRRHDTFLATKAVGRTGTRPWDAGASRKHLLGAIDASLRRLGTDYVDLYQLHSDDRHTPLDETLRALDTIVQSGRARYVGVSNFLAWRLAKALGRADALGLARIVCAQPRYNLIFREMERELLPLAAEENLGVMAYNPLAGGLLTGKHRPDAPPENGRFTLGTTAGTYQNRYWHEREFATVATLTQALDGSGLPLTTAAIAWVLANPAVTCAIIGASRPEQLKDVIAAVDVTFSPALKTRFDEITQAYRMGDAAR